MIEATLEMLRARHREQVAVVGLIAALSDDLDELVEKLEFITKASREHAQSLDGRRHKTERQLSYWIASYAEDLLPAIRRLAK